MDIGSELYEWSKLDAVEERRYDGTWEIMSVAEGQRRFEARRPVQRPDNSSPTHTSALSNSNSTPDPDTINTNTQDGGAAADSNVTPAQPTAVAEDEMESPDKASDSDEYVDALSTIGNYEEESDSAERERKRARLE